MSLQDVPCWLCGHPLGVDEIAPRDHPQGPMHRSCFDQALLDEREGANH